MNKKRGELTSQQIVTISILIISFIVILFFYFKLNPFQESAKELCHTSVVNRATMPTGKETSRLDCKTQQICFSMEGNCLNAPQDAEIIKVKDKEGIIKELANQMYDCWWMMGEGKLDYSGGIGGRVSYCAICSNIYFDDKIKIGLPEIENQYLYNYLTTTNIPGGSKTYAEFLYGTNSFDEIGTKIISTSAGFDGKTPLNSVIDTSKRYSLITSLYEKHYWTSPDRLTAAGTGAGIILGALTVANIWNPVGWTFGGIMVAGGAGVGFLVRHGELDSLPPAMIPNDNVKELNCKDFPNLY